MFDKFLISLSNKPSSQVIRASFHFLNRSLKTRFELQEYPTLLDFRSTAFIKYLLPQTPLWSTWSALPPVGGSNIKILLAVQSLLSFSIMYFTRVWPSIYWNTHLVKAHSTPSKCKISGFVTNTSTFQLSWKFIPCTSISVPSTFTHTNILNQCIVRISNTIILTFSCPI